MMKVTPSRAFEAASCPGRELPRQNPVPLRPLPSEADIRADARAFLAAHPVPEKAALEKPSHSAGAGRGTSQESVTTARRASQSRMKCPKQGWEQHHIFAAIEKSDLVALSDIRDKNFNLFLQAQPGTGLFPLKHAMNVGDKVVTLTLVGFLSTWVNHLDEAALHKDDARLLNALRINLYEAMKFGLEYNKLEPLASYVQILVMSKHASWLTGHVDAISEAVKRRRPSDAFDVAARAVDHFITEQLRQSVAEVADYRNNAVSDLVMMACVKALNNVDAIPASCFGRDERVFNEFSTRLRDAKTNLPAPSKRLLAFCDDVHNIMGSRNVGLSAKVALLQEKCKA